MNKDNRYLGESQTLKHLPPDLRKNGYKYKLVLIGKRSSIYKQTVSDSAIYFEVFLNRIKPESNINGKIIPAKEWFPHDEAFGYWAWVFRNKERAIKRFNSLENKL